MKNPNLLHHEPNPRRRARVQWAKVVVGGAFFITFLFLIYLFLSYVIPILSSFYNREGL